MSFDSLLVHTAEVWHEPTAVDRFGQPAEVDPSSPPDATYRCRLSTARGSERFTDRSRGVVAEQYSLFLPLSAELSESDRVTVRNRAGQLLVERANVTFVSTPEDSRSAHHREAKLQAERSSHDARPT